MGTTTSGWPEGYTDLWSSSSITIIISIVLSKVLELDISVGDRSKILLGLVKMSMETELIQLSNILLVSTRLRDISIAEPE